MIPRYGVLKNLKANELPEGDLDFYSAVIISEDKFLNKFVLPLIKIEFQGYMKLMLLLLLEKFQLIASFEEIQ